jgi:hypothetical protein
MKFNNAAKNAMLDGVDATWNNGQCRIWTGAAPGPAALATGTKIAVGELPADLFAVAAAAKKSLNASFSVTGQPVAGAGTNMGYGRILQDADDDTASETQPRGEFSIGTEGVAINITGAAIVGGQAEFTVVGHGLANGDVVRIAGHNAAYNRKWKVNTIAANTFRVNNDAAVNGANGTGRKSFQATVDNVSIADGQVANFNTLDLEIP